MIMFYYLKELLEHSRESVFLSSGFQANLFEAEVIGDCVGNIASAERLIAYLMPFFFLFSFPFFLLQFEKLEFYCQILTCDGH